MFNLPTILIDFNITPSIIMPINNDYLIVEIVFLEDYHSFVKLFLT